MPGPYQPVADYQSFLADCYAVLIGQIGVPGGGYYNFRAVCAGLGTAFGAGKPPALRAVMVYAGRLANGAW